MMAWKQQLDALEDQHEQLTLGAGVRTASVSVNQDMNDLLGKWKPSSC